MSELVRWLRAVPRSIVDGFAGLWDMLLWGRVYPRSISLETLRRMKEQRNG